MTLDEIGKAFGVRREWIRQIEKSAFAKLRESREGRELVGLLGESGSCAEFSAPVYALEMAESYEARESA